MTFETEPLTTSEKSTQPDFILAGCVVTAALAYLYADAHLQTPASNAPVGPAVFPAIIGIGLLLSGVLLFFETRKRRAAFPPSGVRQFSKARHLPVLLAVAVWTCIYDYAFTPVGYLVSTTVYLFPMLAYFNRGHWLANGLIAVGFSIVAYLVFARLLLVALPTGILAF